MGVLEKRRMEESVSDGDALLQNRFAKEVTMAIGCSAKR